MFYSTKVGGGRSGGLHGYDLFAPKLPVLSSPQEFFSRSERCGEAQCVAFFRAPRLFPFSSFSHSNIVFFFYSTHYPTGPQIILPHPHMPLQLLSFSAAEKVCTSGKGCNCGRHFVTKCAIFYKFIQHILCASY